MTWAVTRTPVTYTCAVCAATVIPEPLYKEPESWEIVGWQPSSRYWAPTPPRVFCSAECSLKELMPCES